MNKNCIDATAKQEADEYTPHYSIKKVSELTGISIYTLRYYDKEKLFPFLYRNDKNIRVFSNADVEWIKLIECLRKANMPIEEIRHYVALNLVGDSTLEERYHIICNQEDALKQQLKDIKTSLKHIQYKKEYYQEQLNKLPYPNGHK